MPKSYQIIKLKLVFDKLFQMGTSFNKLVDCVESFY